MKWLALACLLPSLAFAQSAKLSKDQPIEIVADQLEVIEPKQQAIFSGNVLAKQGDIDLKAQRMVVHYRNKNANSDAQGIRKIDATGDVFFIAPGETARGDAATYDVDSDRILLNGNVVLTQGDNVIRGTKLTYDLAQGRSIVSSAGVGGSQSGGRVRSLFVPGQN